jgi:hypothetical protein
MVSKGAKEMRMYKVNEVLVSPEKAMAIKAMHQTDMKKADSINKLFDLMGMDNPALIAHYGKIYDQAQENKDKE